MYYKIITPFCCFSAPAATLLALFSGPKAEERGPQIAGGGPQAPQGGCEMVCAEIVAVVMSGEVTSEIVKTGL